MSILCRQEPVFTIGTEFEVHPPRTNCNQLQWFPVLFGNQLTHTMLLQHFPAVPMSKAGLPLHCCSWLRHSPGITKVLSFIFSPGDGWETFDGTISCWMDRIWKKNKTLTSSLNYSEKTISPLGKVYSSGKLRLFPCWV